MILPATTAPPAMFRASSMLALIVVLICVGCGDDQPRVTARGMETKIEPTLQRQLRKQLDDGSVLVDDLDCVKKGKSDGTCLARFSDSAGESASARIAVDIDPDTGRAIWRVTEISGP